MGKLPALRVNPQRAKAQPVGVFVAISHHIRYPPEHGNQLVRYLLNLPGMAAPLRPIRRDVDVRRLLWGHPTGREAAEAYAAFTRVPQGGEGDSGRLGGNLAPQETRAKLS